MLPAIAIDKHQVKEQNICWKTTILGKICFILQNHFQSKGFLASL